MPNHISMNNPTERKAYIITGPTSGAGRATAPFCDVDDAGFPKTDEHGHTSRPEFLPSETPAIPLHTWLTRQPPERRSDPGQQCTCWSRCYWTDAAHEGEEDEIHGTDRRATDQRDVDIFPYDGRLTR
jgi:hypothetical protein